MLSFEFVHNKKSLKKAILQGYFWDRVVQYSVEICDF